MVAITVITATAHAETAKQAILKRLHDADATNAAMPASVEIDSDTWLKDVASDGVSTVLLDVSGDGAPVVRRIENEPVGRAAIE